MRKACQQHRDPAFTMRLLM